MRGAGCGGVPALTPAFTPALTIALLPQLAGGSLPLPPALRRARCGRGALLPPPAASSGARGCPRAPLGSSSTPTAGEVPPGGEAPPGSGQPRAPSATSPEVWKVCERASCRGGGCAVCAALRGGGGRGGGRLYPGAARRCPCAIGVPPGLCEGLRIKERLGASCGAGIISAGPHKVPD